MINAILKVFSLLCLIGSATAADVKMDITSSSLSVIQLSQYNITIQRNVSKTGTIITPQSVGSPMLVEIVFVSQYDLSSTTLKSSSANVFSSSVNNSNRTIFINQSQSNVMVYTFSNIRNPIPSGNSFRIYANIRNSGNILADSAQATLTFTTLPLSNSSWNLQSGNVSTLSNLTLTIQPAFWSTSEMTIKLALRQYWTRNLLNFSSSQILPTSATCSPSCVISRQSSFSQISFSNLPQNVSIILVIRDINSPPTLEAADSISISIEEKTYNSIVQSQTLLLSSTKPNSFQSLAVTSTSQIRKPLSLSLQFVTRDIFGPNDTIQVVLNSLLNSTANSIALVSSLVSTYSTEVPSESSIKFSNLALITTNYNRLLATINIVGVVYQTSTKPVLNNQIIIKRNGFQYNRAYFSFAAQKISFLQILLSLSNSFANSNNTCQFRILFSTTVQPTHEVQIKIPQDIIIYSCTAQCTNCICTISQQPSPSFPFYSLLISNVTNSLSSLTTIINLKNPISSGYQIQACSTDSQNYTMECGSTTYPNMTEATLDGSSISVLFSNSSVYGIANYTITINMSNFNLQNGFLTLRLPQALSIINPDNIICTINGATFCNVLQTTPSVNIKVTVQSSIKIYTFIINNLRNPKSTQEFKLNAQFANTMSVNYFSILSNFYSVTEPYVLSSFDMTSSSCKNSQSNNMLNFNFQLPFNTTGLVYSSDNQISTSFSNPLVTSIRNSNSFQPVKYSLLIMSSNGLYKIFSFSFTFQNCQATQLALNGFNFAGIPQDAGVLRISFNNPYKVESIQIIFPTEYPQSLSIASTFNQVSTISPRVFAISVAETDNPVEVSIYNFTNPLQSGMFRLSTYRKGYLVSESNSTIKYSYSSPCSFPCKICQIANFSICRTCYSSALTNQYLLNQITNMCVSSCPSGTHLEIGTNMCRKCPSECGSCKNQTFCQSCIQNYYLFNNTCVTDCPAKYYPINIQQTCQSCVSPCLNCLSKTYCSTCVNGYYLFEGQTQSTCTLNCAQPYLAIDSVCRKCQLPCSTCSVGLTNCTSCVSGQYLNQNFKCVSVCASPKIGFNGLCVACSSNCVTCIVTPQTCTSCSSPLTLSDSKCLSNCPIGFYGDQNVCIRCSSKCTQCYSSTVCSKCATGFTFLSSNGSCLQSCPLTFYAQSGQCRSCSPSCLECSNSNFCTLCQKIKLLYANTCVESCPVANLAIGGECKPCPSGCKTCISLTACDSCLNTYGLHQGACLTSCPTGTTNINLTCLQCQNLYDDCNTCNSLGCTKCQPGFSVSSSSLCVLQCLSNQVSINGQCKICSTGCTQCQITTSNCTTCDTNFYFIPETNTCVKNCLSPKIGFNRECVACKLPCLTCSITPFTCSSCANNTLLLQSNSSCLKNCPTGFYGGVSKCLSCQSGCSSCDQIGCLQCLGTKLKDLLSNNRYNCYDSCPSHLPYIVNGSFCKQCSIYCLSCNSQQCLICDQTYLRFGLFCVKNCPAGYWEQSRSCTNEQNNNTIPQPEKNNTNNITQPQKVPISTAPVPLSITFAIGFVGVGISKLNYGHTVATLGLFSIGCVICQVCNVFYLGLFWPQYILIVSVMVSYILNLLYLILSRLTIDQDQKLKQFKQEHSIWWYISKVISLATFHMFYVSLFSKLFNIRIFKAKLSTVRCLKYLNVLWGISMVSFVLGVVSGIVGLANSQVFQIGYIDLLVVNLLMLLFAIVLFRKTKDVFQDTEEATTDAASNKKVKLEQSSNLNIEVQVDSMEQLNGYLVSKNPNQIANTNDVYPLDSDQSIESLKIDSHLNLMIPPQHMNPPTLDRQDSDTQEQKETLSKQNDVAKIISNDNGLSKDQAQNIFQGMYESEEAETHNQEKISNDIKQENVEQQVANLRSSVLTNERHTNKNKSHSSSSRSASKGKGQKSSNKNAKIFEQYNSSKSKANSTPKSSQDQQKNDQRRTQSEQRQRKSKLSRRSHSALRRVTQEEYHQDQEQFPNMNKSQNISLTFNMKSPSKVLQKNEQKNKKQQKVLDQRNSINLSKYKSNSVKSSCNLQSHSSPKLSKSPLSSEKSDILKNSPYLSKSNKSLSQNKVDSSELAKKQSKSKQFKSKKSISSIKSSIKATNNILRQQKIPNKYSSNLIQQQQPLNLNTVDQDILRKQRRTSKKGTKKTAKSIDKHRYISQSPHVAPFTFQNNARISGMHTLFIQSEQQKDIDYNEGNQHPPSLNTINQPVQRLQAEDEDIPVQASRIETANSKKESLKGQGLFKKDIKYIERDDRKLDVKLLAKQIQRKARIQKQQQELRNIYLTTRTTQKR